MCFSGNENSIVNTAKSRVQMHAPHCWGRTKHKNKFNSQHYEHPNGRANSGKSVWRVRFRRFGFNVEALSSCGVCRLLWFFPKHVLELRRSHMQYECTISIHRRRTINCVLRKIFIASLSSSAVAAAATTFLRPYNIELQRGEPQALAVTVCTLGFVAVMAMMMIIAVIVINLAHIRFQFPFCCYFAFRTMRMNDTLPLRRPPAIENQRNVDTNVVAICAATEKKNTDSQTMVCL